jgi:hypothetical protein
MQNARSPKSLRSRRSPRRSRDFVVNYLAWRSEPAESAIAKFENVTPIDFAKRTAKQSPAKLLSIGASQNKTANTYVIEITL